MSISSSAGVLPTELTTASELKCFGRATLSDYFDDLVIYRDLEPLDKQLPGLKSIANEVEISNGHIPRKQEEDYAKVALWFMNRVQQTRGVAQPLDEILFIGDSFFNDGHSYRNMRTMSGWQGTCFIGDEKPSQTPKADVQTESGLYCANRWAALGDWAVWAVQQGLRIDAGTVVVVDIDKTALGAKGRNDALIDQARLEGIYRTMDAVLGSNFDRAAFERQYAELNQSDYHCLTEDNQDYLAYVCLVLNTQLIGFDELIGEVQSGNIDNFEQFTRWVNIRLMLNHIGIEALQQVHETIITSVRMGDPTPFKSFRRQEFITTVERMGIAPDEMPADELLQQEITLTNEVAEFAQWCRERNCLLICMSDKPSEASCPDPHITTEWLPLHRVETHLVGTSIRPRLDTL